MADLLSRILVGQDATMGGQGCASVLCTIYGPQDDQVAIPSPRENSSSLLHRLVKRYASDEEFQKLLPTRKN